MKTCPFQEGRRPSSRQLRVPRLFLEIGIAVQAHGALVRRHFVFAQLLRRPCPSLEMPVTVGPADEQGGMPNRPGWSYVGRNVVEPQADAAVRRRVRAGPVRTQAMMHGEPAGLERHGHRSAFLERFGDDLACAIDTVLDNS